FCAGRELAETPATVGKLSGAYKGVLKGPTDTTTWKAGTQEVTKVIPEHPFLAKKLRVNFSGTGKVRLRLVTTFGRSYPGSFPSTAPKTLPDFIDPPDLFPPIELDIADAKPDAWTEVDIPPTWLLPTQHYDIVYEHLASATGEPYLALEEKAADDTDRSALFQPPKRDMFGVPGNYRMELAGSYFCAWKDDERDFAPPAKTAFSDVSVSWITFRDIDGDGHDDAVVSDGSGKLFFGDGKGAFKAAGFDPFPDTPRVHSMVFGDLDNDGDQDAFVSVYVQPDGDGDGYTVDVDCDDTKDTVHPGATETKNGFDDDCDGKADDGLDTTDADGDGISIAKGDCDDTRKDVCPGAPELLDGVDNDCNGKTDEIFVSKILLNDGKSHFAQMSNKAVEIIAPSTAVALGDGNVDGNLDIYAGSWLVHYPDFPTVPSRYYEGDGKGGFTDALAKAGMALDPARPVYGVMWTDWNDDGLPDLYVSNYNLRDNVLWKNVGGGKFVDVAPATGADHDSIPTTDPNYPGGHSFGSDIGDFDNDGDMDIFVADISHPRTQPWADPSRLLVNQGAPEFKFVDERRAKGIIYDEGDVNSLWLDYDNDGDLDLVVAPTYPSHYTKLYRNDGKDGFVDVTYEAHLAVHMGGYAVASDVDEDGDLDLLVTGVAPSANTNLLLNRIGNKNNWVFFDLRGTTSNRDGVGAKVVVTAGGLTQTRELKGGGGGTPSHGNSHLLHFGLAKASAIEKVTVRWLGGATETFTGATVNGRFTLVEGSGKAVAR
ncbi:MAG: FG-GAP-like repeat-containing protein, partial [Polyangiales bacterium]